MTLETLLEAIEMPNEAAQAVLRASKEQALPDGTLQKLFVPASWQSGLDELQAALGADEWGVGMLAALLTCALKTHENYARAGVGDDIFIATMKCFTRFEKEHEVSYGRIGFDRAFWVPRQLCMKLFRLGELEYELCEEKGRVNLHIPSDARLLPALLHESWEQALAFFAVHAPDYAQPEVHCESWLLYPALESLLPPQSRILQFRQAFELFRVDDDAPDYLEWVFKLGAKQRKNTRLSELAETASCTAGAAPKRRGRSRCDRS